MQLINLNFIMQLLQGQQTRYHQNMRPRFTNPTFASSNVGSSLGLHMSFFKNQSRNEYKTQSNPLTRPHKSMSYLSQNGSASLQKLYPHISDKDVYEKQSRKYNIINVQPKEYTDTIKVFPKYRLENIDSNYYKKVKLEQQIGERHIQQEEQRQHNDRKENNERQQKREKMLQESQQMHHSQHFNPELNHSDVPMRGKYLNTLDEVRDVM